MATIKSSADHVTINADGVGKDIILKANDVEVGRLSSAGVLTTSEISATKAVQDTGGNVRSGRKNLIINGAMTVAQEATTGTFNNGSSGFYSADMFQAAEGGAFTGAFTVSNDTDAPAGFANSTKWDCTTADASLAASDYLRVDYKIEAQDMQHLNYGTADALQTTISFWIKSNKTGTYVLWAWQQDDDRHVQVQYTIDNADTWENKSCLIPADTVGVIDNNNGIGINFRWIMGAGSDYTSGTAASSWAAEVEANRYVGQTVNLADSTSNYMNITGVQLEVGSVATDFEHVSYGENLAACQRYYYAHATGLNQSIAHGALYSSGLLTATFSLPVTMRSSPSMDVSNGTNHFRFYRNGGDDLFDTITGLANASTTSIAFDVNSGISGTAGHGGRILTNDSAARLHLDARL